MKGSSNPKLETSSNHRNSNDENEQPVEHFENLNFEFVSDFELRI